jgi:hypothetical protein
MIVKDVPTDDDVRPVREEGRMVSVAMAEEVQVDDEK